MTPCELRRATLDDTDTVYALLCELKQSSLDYHAFCTGFAFSLQDSNMHYQLALLDGKVVGLISLYIQYRLNYINWAGEVQQLIVMPQARGLNVGRQLLAWAEKEAHLAGAKVMELSSNIKRHDAHRFYQREGYQQSHYRFIKTL